MERVLGVIVPVYNEAATLPVILGRVVSQATVGQVVIVDDGSTDDSRAIAQRFSQEDPRLTVRWHTSNQGKGAAIRTGLDSIRMPITIIQDADLEYDPLEYEAVIRPIVEGRSDVVFGVRGFASETAYSYWFVVGNRVVTTFTNILFNCYIKDMETGFKAMRTDLMRRLRLSGRRFGIEPDITARVLRLGYRIHEVPISYYARGREEGKKLTWLDGLKALGTLVRIRLTPRERLFGHADPYHAARQRELAAQVRMPALPDGLAEVPADARARRGAR